jgi:hypothetical protein
MADSKEIKRIRFVNGLTLRIALDEILAEAVELMKLNGDDNADIDQIDIDSIEDQVVLFEETLSDGSKVYNIEFA